VTREQIFARFHHMMNQSGTMRRLEIVDEAELWTLARGTEDSEKLRSMQHVIALVPESYWQRVGL
jgi:hypothetical protein